MDVLWKNRDRLRCSAWLLVVLMLLSTFAGCSSDSTVSADTETEETVEVTETVEAEDASEESEDTAESVSAKSEEAESQNAEAEETEEILVEAVASESASATVVETAVSASSISLSDIPEYSGDPYIVINGNVPFFTESELTTTAFETYSDLDSLGRCGVAYANICLEIMPTEDRDSISSVTPTGWHSVTYDIVDGNYLYNRCHLIGFQLAGENANEKNLIAGTRYLNVDGMLPFENMVADYVEETENHVLYRVTPMFDGDNLVASGVLMEAMSVEDDGEGILFCVYCYNVQPGVSIDYATGESALDGTVTSTSSETTVAASETTVSSSETSESTSEQMVWIPVNGGTKYHSTSTCSNMVDPEYVTKSEAESRGYTACKKCW